MPDEDLSQQAAPPIDVSTPPSPIEDAPQPTPLEPTPPESAPMPDAPVADTPVETEPPVEVPVENPIAEPIPPTPVESASVNNSPAPVIISPAAPDHSSSVYLKSLNPLSLASRMRHRDGRKERLLAHVAEKGHVTRRDAQLLLEVSGATADRYLRELASEGRIVKESDGRYTKYKFVA